MKKWVLFLTLGGFFLRLFFLTKHEFWFDEAFSYFLAPLPVFSLLTATAADNNPPLYYLLLKGLLTFRQEIWYLRSLSLVAGTLSIPLVYLIARQWRFEKAVAVLSTLLFTLSPLIVYFSTETRMYQLLVFEGLLIVYAFNILSEKKSFLPSLLFVGIGIAGIYTHYYFFILLFLLFLSVLTRQSERRYPGYWILMNLFIGISFLPWLPFYFSFEHPGCWCFPPAIGFPATLASFFVNGVGVSTFRTFLLLPHFMLFQLLLVAGTLLLLTLIPFRTVLREKSMQMPLSLVIGSFSLVVAVSLFRPFFSPRAFLLIAPFFYMLTGFSVYEVVHRSFRFASILLIILLGSVLLLFATEKSFYGQPLKESEQFVSSSFQEGDRISHTSVYTFYSYQYFSPEKKQYLTLQAPLSPDTISLIGGYADPIESVILQGGRLWFIHFPEWTPISKAEETKLMLARHFQLITMKRFGSIE